MRVNIRSILIDLLLAVVLTALTVAGMPLAERADPQALALAVLSTVPIVLGRVAPIVTMLIIGGAMIAYSLLGHADFPIFGIGLLVSLYTVARHRTIRVAAIAWLAVMILTMWLSLPTAAPSGWPTVVNGLLQAVTAWVLGDSVQRWARRNKRLAKRAERAAAEERVRIARELHDIVAHHMAVISLQSGVARYVLDTDPAAVREALIAVNDSGRAALAEMRRLLDVLRVDSDTDYSPQPGLAQLPDLVDRIRSAGLAVELDITGTSRELPPGPDLCAYRVAQEALTNVLKHAGPARARMNVDYGHSTLTLRVADDGVGVASSTGSLTPHGITGMRERAELYGGVLTAGRASRAGSLCC
ncbi:sensor histidine kinase [Nocardia sp. CA-128927]|uniref:sensor histidine kinase n=1 Tax=Nocardia sp. CA-128927 TaxID=3239975 RepID=UPI003D966E84